MLLMQGPTAPFPIPPEAIHAAIMVGRYFFAGCVILGVVPPLIRLVTGRWAQPKVIAAGTPPETAAQLKRIEQAVEAVAIEVERIAEAQRFSAKLMAGQARALPQNAER